MRTQLPIQEQESAQQAATLDLTSVKPLEQHKLFCPG